MNAFKAAVPEAVDQRRQIGQPSRNDAQERNLASRTTSIRPIEGVGLRKAIRRIFRPVCRSSFSSIL